MRARSGIASCLPRNTAAGIGRRDSFGPGERRPQPGDWTYEQVGLVSLGVSNWQCDES
jgi:hypothetical protein